MPSKLPSIALGAAVFAVAYLFTGYIGLQGGDVAQYFTAGLCCLSALAGPFVAVWHYTSTHDVTMPAGPGAGLGAAAVAIGGLVSSLVTLGLQAVGAYPPTSEILDRQRSDLLAQGMDPSQVDAALQMTEMLAGPAGIAVNLALTAVIGAVGGAIAASIFKRGAVEG